MNIREGIVLSFTYAHVKVSMIVKYMFIITLFEDGKDCFRYSCTIYIRENYERIRRVTVTIKNSYFLFCYYKKINVC